MHSNLVSIVLPTYNEKESICLLVDEIHEKLALYNHEILVVDDNSPDGTYEILQKLNYPFLRPILRTYDKGFANSIRCGVENVAGDIIIIMDSDFNHQPKYLPFMIESLRFMIV
jgi:dolichol-phosphate mannosyltransferase